MRLHWIRAAVMMIAMVALAACMPTPAESPTGPVSLGDPTAFARELFDASNDERAAEGLDRLTWSECLADAALPRATAALGTAPLSHEPLPNPCTAGTTAGENLSRTWRNAEDVVGLWMDSESHRANILNPEFTHSGIACVPYAYDDAALEAQSGEPQGGMVCSQLFEGD